MADRCRAFRFLLQPTAKQAARLGRLLDGHRELYNAALEERRGAWRWQRRAVTRYDQYRTLTGLREVRPDTLAFGVTQILLRGSLRSSSSLRATVARSSSGREASSVTAAGPLSRIVR